MEREKAFASERSVGSIERRRECAYALDACVDPESIEERRRNKESDCFQLSLV